MKFKAKNGHNPDGYGHFLTQKFDKKAIFRTILPYLAVAKGTLFWLFDHFLLHSCITILDTKVNRISGVSSCFDIAIFKCQNISLDTPRALRLECP